jgi:hypothetical protein
MMANENFMKISLATIRKKSFPGFCQKVSAINKSRRGNKSALEPAFAFESGSGASRRHTGGNHRPSPGFDASRTKAPGRAGPNPKSIGNLVFKKTAGQ